MKTILHFFKHILTLICLLGFSTLQAQCIDTISSGRQHSIALKDDGTLWGWGYNNLGQLGNGTTDATATPTQIGTSNDWITVSAGWYFSAALKSDGTLWMWGDNQMGVLGDGTDGVFNQRNSPQQVGTDTNWKSVSAGAGHVLALKTNGTLWAWGTNSRGELGTGDGNPRNIPVQVGLDNSWKSVYGGVNYSLGIKNDGSLWSWGENGKGQLGIGVDLGIDISPRVTPQRVGSSNDWSYATCGNHALALKSDGSLWAWGNNDVGALGDGTTIVRSAPIKIGTSTWKTISAGNLHSLGIKTDGTLWVWGYNFNYQLGDGTKVDRYEPMQVGTASNFKSISAGGEEFSIAIDALGSRWATGANSRGQLGDGTGVLKRYFTETVCESLGIKDIATTENITVYPNPFKESLKINGLGMLNSIQLFDVSGKLLLEKRNINAENFTLHTVEIAQGAYVLIVETPIGSTKIKVVK